MAVDATGIVTREIRIEGPPGDGVRVPHRPGAATALEGDGGRARSATRRGLPRRRHPRTVRGECGECASRSCRSPRRLSCGFEEPDETVPPGASTAEVTLTPDGNSTILRLVHRDLLEPSRSQHDKTRTKPSAGLEPATPSVPWTIRPQIAVF